MLRAFDREARRFHAASHASQLVLRLGPGLDVEALRRLIERTACDAPIVRAPIRRPWLIGAPIYDLTRAPTSEPPPLRVHDTDRDSSVPFPPEPFTAALNEPFAGSRGELLRFDLVRYADGAADLALTWLHMLLDGTGSELFLRALAGVGSGARDAVGLEVGDVDGGRPLSERGRRAREWQGFIESFARLPPRSPAGPLRRARQDLAYRVTTLDEDETRSVVARAGEKAGFMTPVTFYMAASIRAHHRLFQRRGAVPTSYVVPLPVNLRPRGQEGAIFRTHVSMIWFQVLPAQLESFDGLVAELKRQRRDAIRGGLIDAGADAIEFARYLPAGLFGRMVRRTFGGELCSFFFAFTGDFAAGVETFLGAPVRNGFHVPAVPPSPGSCAAMSLYGGRLNLTHVYQRGALSEEEVRRFAADMRAELLPGAR
jgi:hypothetical protein